MNYLLRKAAARGVWRLLVWHRGSTPRRSNEAKEAILQFDDGPQMFEPQVCIMFCHGI